MAADEKAETVAHLLDDIARQSSAGDLGGFRNTITKCLVPPRRIDDVADDQSFWVQAERLFGGLPDNDATVAFALAEIGRLQATLNAKIRQRLQPLAKTLLAKRTPLHFCFGDSDQAAFAAKGWACSGHPVDVTVAARTIVLAEGPKPIMPWIDLTMAAGVSSLLEHITAALADAGATHGESPKKRSVRLQRILKGFRAALDADRVSLDSGVTAAVTEFVAGGYRGIGRPDQYTPAAKTVDELMALVLHLIRMDLKLLTEPAIYNSLARAKGWLPDGGWIRFTRSAAGASRLRRTLLDGVAILLKQHNPNRALLESHRMLSPDRRTALEELQAVADEDRDIPAKERQWLASGGEATLPQEVKEVSENDDAAIASALLAVDALARCALFAAEPGDAETAELVRAARDVRGRVLSVASRRNLRMFGDHGEVVKYSRAAHRLVTPDAAPNDVKVVERGVESVGSFGSRVLVPALVSPC